MIVTFMPQGGNEQETLPADGAIINPVSGEITFVDREGDAAKVDFDVQHSVIIQDEGGDEGEQVAS